MWFQRKKVDPRRAERLKADTALVNTMRRISTMLEEGEDEATVREQLKLALEQHPQSGWGHFMAGIVMNRFGCEDEALQLLGLAIALDPHHSASYRLMATILQRQGKLQQAEAVLANGWKYYSQLRRPKPTEQDREKYWQVRE